MNTRPVKLLFDECVGLPQVRGLDEFIRISVNPPQIQHLLDFYVSGILDEDWIPRSKDGGWTIITQDKTRFRKGKGIPLKHVCLANNITHIVLSPVVGQRKSFEKLMTILHLWYEILEIASASPGDRWAIEPVSQSESERGRGRLIKRTPQRREPRKGELFGDQELREAHP